ncbi:MAG TPA: protein kinase, partial [Conexibacter sp.]|nr:protein kinase [Conexibacter sp.]
LGTLPSGAPYLVMELLEGETLGDRLERVGKLELAVALDFARQTASALGAAHARGIVHRDLKPDNVFLVPDPRLPGRELVKVLDFGIAKLRGELTATPVHTMAGALMGTPSYMSPEQCRGVPDQLDHRTDIYALGVMLYEMVCGAPPFVSDALGDTMMMHMSVPPPPPSSLGVEVPEEVEQAILQALAKRPEERFASMAELRAALELAPSPVVVFPAAVHVGERSAARVLVSGVRGGVPGPRIVELEPTTGERARPVSATGPRRIRAQPARDAAADTAGPTARDLELAGQPTDPEAATQRTRRDDEDTAPGGGPRSLRRSNATALGALLCAAIAAAGWMLRGPTASDAAIAARPSASQPARLAPKQPPAAAAPSVPMAAVTAPTSAPAAELAPKAEPTTASADAVPATARRTRVQRAAEPAAPGRAGVDTANSFEAVAAADDWQAKAGESIAASEASTAPASSASQAPGADSLATPGGPSTDDSVPATRLAGSAPKAQSAAEPPLAPRAATAAAAKSSPPPPATGQRVVIEDLLVRGSLPESVIRRGIERVRSDFESCYRKVGGGAGGAGLGRVGVRFELDELGRVRDAQASGSSVASLDRCLAEATRHVTSRRAPDTGTVHGSFQLVLAR